MDWVTFVQLVFGGLTIGCVYSLVGLGFALTLRATELINFAQGEMVMLGAFIGLTAVSVLHLPFYGVFLVAMVLTGFFGVFMERFILRPILSNKAPLLNLLIATLGISIALQAVAVIVWGRDPLPYPALSVSPYAEIFGIRFQVLNMWILGLGFASMAGLHLFFQKTMTGISWRAASLDPSTAALYGVNRRTNVALTFGISAALGGGAGVLIAPLFFASSGIGHSVLVKAFAAAAMGGFGVVGTMLGGLALGVVETLAAGLVSSEYKNVIMYGILLVILMFFSRPKVPAGRSITDGSKVVVNPAVNLSEAFSAPWLKPACALLLVGLWLLLPLLCGHYTLRILNMAFILSIAVLGLQLIVGYTGQFSFGHAAFYGIGAYASALLCLHYQVSFFVSMPIAAVCAGLAGWIVAPILRLSGHFLAIATLAMGEIVFLLMMNWKWLTKGAYGLYGIPFPRIGRFELASDEAYYILTSLTLGIVFFFLRRLTVSRFGRALVAVRENELAAVTCGVRVFNQKMRAFVIGSGCAGLAGALYAHYISFINPESFKFGVSVEMVTMVVIGGLGSMTGGIIGSLVVILLPEYLRFLADYRLVVYGILIITFMMFLPGGLSDLAQRPARWICERAKNRTQKPRG